MRIPFNKPAIVGREIDYVRQAVASGNLAGEGAFTERACRILSERIGAPRVLLTPSCTAALELAAMTLEWGPGDEVIVPSFTFVSTASAVARAGARPVFVDIEPETLGLDPDKVAAAMGPRTRGIIPVHYAGVGCRWDEILPLADRAGATVVEDAAHALGAASQGRPLGSMGAMATLSFHETKNVNAGQGGALLINDERWAERAEILRDKGTNRAAHFRGEVDKYTWVAIGSALQMSELTAAYLTAQLEQLDAITRHRRHLFGRYASALAPLARAGCFRLPTIPSSADPNGHIFFLLLPDEATRDRLLKFLQSRGIGAVFHYVPLHLSPVGESLGYRPGGFPVTEAMARRLLRLPMYHELGAEQQDEVIGAVAEFFGDGEKNRTPATPESCLVPAIEGGTTTT